MKAQEITIKKRNCLILLLFMLMAPVLGWTQELTFEKADIYSEKSKVFDVKRNGQLIGQVIQRTPGTPGFDVVNKNNTIIGTVDPGSLPGTWIVYSEKSGNFLEDNLKTWQAGVKKYFFKKK